MSETYDLYQQGREHLAAGHAAQATVALEKAKKREPSKASIREALGIAYYRIRRFAEAEEDAQAPPDLTHCLALDQSLRSGHPLDDGAHRAAYCATCWLWSFASACR